MYGIMASLRQCRVIVFVSLYLYRPKASNTYAFVLRDSYFGEDVIMIASIALRDWHNKRIIYCWRNCSLHFFTYAARVLFLSLD